MSQDSNSPKAGIQWIPIGVAIGTSIGVAIKDMGLGISLGLFVGSAISLGVERRAKKPGGALLFVVAVIALVVTVAVALIGRR